MNGRNFLLLGKSGNGKSCSGNSLLQWNFFKVGYGMSSQTDDVQLATKEYKDFLLKVVDGPGPKDTRLSKEEQDKYIAGKLQEAIQITPEGYDAFLLIAKFGNRWTEEEQDVVNLLKNLLSPDIVKNHCILVMTGKDQFDAQGLDLDDWCSEQTGPFKDLLNECEGRIVLFDNRTTDENKKVQQIDTLLSKVDSLSARGGRYTDDNFKAAAVVRDTYLVECETAVYREDVQQQVDAILQKVSREDLTTADFQQLSVEINETLKEIQEKDKGTGVLKNLIEKMENLKAAVARAVIDEEARKNLDLQATTEELFAEHIKARKSYTRGLFLVSLSVVGIIASAGLSVAVFFVGGPAATAAVAATTIPRVVPFILGAGAAVSGGGAGVSGGFGISDLLKYDSVKTKIAQKLSGMFIHRQVEGGKQDEEQDKQDVEKKEQI